MPTTNNMTAANIEAGFDQFAKTLDSAATTKSGWQMPANVQRRIINNALKIDPEEIRWQKSINHQFLVSKSASIEKADLPDQLASDVATDPAYVDATDTNADTIAIRRIEYPIFYDEDKLVSLGQSGTSVKKFIANIEGELGDRVIEDDNWSGFNGVLQNQYFAANEPENACIGLLQLIRNFDSGSRRIVEKRTASGVVTVGAVRKMPLDPTAITDKGSGKVGLPVTRHNMPIGSEIIISGTSNYNGRYSIEVETTANEIVIAKAFTVESGSYDKKVTLVPDFEAEDKLAEHVIGLESLWPSTWRGKRHLAITVNPSLITGSAQVRRSIHGRDPEKRLAEMDVRQNRIANRTTFALPTFPSKTMLIAINQRLTQGHHQNQTIRRVNQEERGLKNYFRKYRGFGIQDYAAVALIENIEQIQPFEV